MWSPSLPAKMILWKCWFFNDPVWKYKYDSLWRRMPLPVRGTNGTCRSSQTAGLRPVSLRLDRPSTSRSSQRKVCCNTTTLRFTTSRQRIHYNKNHSSAPNLKSRMAAPCRGHRVLLLYSLATHRHRQGSADITEITSHPSQAWQRHYYLNREELYWPQFSTTGRYYVAL